MSTSGLTRREWVRKAGAFAALAAAAPAKASEPAVSLSLRLLETSDLHMFVLDWDYYGAKPDETVGFVKTASLIEAARAERANTLLFDNGDFLQGNPLGDWAAAGEPPSDEHPHPIVKLMRELRYDAAGLGNHEFNYGLPFLEASLARSPFPFVCANITRTNGVSFLPPTAVLERKFRDAAGGEQILRIGVIGFVPPQILVWDKSRLEGRIETSDIVAAARRYVPDLRARCDVLVALCHAGISAAPYVEGMENAALHLAAVPGIDVIFTGHSHRVFPGKDYQGLAGVDAVAGRLAGVPAVMPGFWGSHLGIVDLDLKREDGAWRVEKATCEARPIYKRDAGKVVTLVGNDKAVETGIAPAHQATLAWVERKVGELASPVHSYFVWAGYDPASALVNAAQVEYARPLLKGTRGEGLPLLSFVAPYRAGYTPDSFIDLPAGAVPLREVADLYFYGSNTVAAVRVTGEQILEWLEYAARVFNQIDPSKSEPQALIDKHFPSYNFDIMSGVAYRIDPTQPPRYDSAGKLNASARRIVDLTFEGSPIDLKREFVVVGNNYRLDGGGGFPSLKGAENVLRAPDPNRDAVLAYFRMHEKVSAPNAGPWRFVGQPGAPTVWFDTSRKAAERLADAPGVTALGDGEPGYLRVGIKLG